MYFWNFLIGLEYLIGAIATVAVFCVTKKVVTLVSLLLFAAIMIYFLMCAQYMFFYSQEAWWRHNYVREDRATEVVVFTD